MDSILTVVPGIELSSIKAQGENRVRMDFEVSFEDHPYKYTFYDVVEWNKDTQPAMFAVYAALRKIHRDVERICKKMEEAEQELEVQTLRREAV